MRQKFITQVLIAVITSAASCFAQSYKWNNPGTQLPAGITHATYHSNLMNTDIGYNVYLPPNYNSNTDRFPVVYSLHGMGGNENSNCQAYGSILQNGINGKEFPPVIVVFVNGRGNTFYSDSKDKSVTCESSIMNELIKYIDATYRTKADRTQRAIEGISMGGFGTLMLGFKHPDSFGSIATYDAALVTWDTLSQQTFDRSIPTSIFGNDKNYFNENSYPFTFAKKNAATIKSLGIKVRMITGDNDKQMGPLYYYNLAMRDTLKALGISLDFKVIPGGTHGAGMNSTTIKENMIFHTNNFNTATGVINTHIPIRTLSEVNSGSFAIPAISHLTIPARWQQSRSKLSIYDLGGRNRGRVQIQNGTMISEQSGSGLYLLK